MIVVNLSHPLTATQQAEIETLTGQSVAKTVGELAKFDNQRPYLPQVEQLINSLPLTSEEWQTAPILLNPPGLAPAAAIVIANLHGRMGHFSAICRIRPVLGSTPTVYEVAEVINLQQIRENLREER